VDDHPKDRTLIRVLLEEHEEFEIVGEAADGEEAVALAASRRPDIILMDMFLPRVDGVEATRRIIRALPATAIIGISSQYSPQAYNAMITAGAAAFVRKEDVVSAIYKTIRFSLHARPNRVE
jgi:LuxR family maltose regulon positive regulatory protein